MRARRWLAVIGAALAVGACTPTTPPLHVPSWVTTRFARATTGGTTVNYIGAWTSDQWFATQRLETTPTGGTTSIQFSPRSGLGGATLGSPQVLPLTSGGGFGGFSGGGGGFSGGGASGGW